MQGWEKWLIYILAVIGAIVVIGLMGAFIYWIVTIIKDKIEDYRDRYLKYENYYLEHKYYEETSDIEETLFFVRLDTGEEYAFEIGNNFEKYGIVNGKLFNSDGCYIGKIEKIILRGKKE